MLPRYSALAAIVLLVALLPRACGQDDDPVKKAVARGAALLQSLQKDDGSWPHHDKTGMTALAGLALLEAGVAKKDPCIQRAAAFVREKIPELTHTYSISLALLFLDRLGWDKDIPLLEGLGLRLLTGQNDFGGWSYHCQLPREKEIGRLQQIAKENNSASTDELKPRELTKNRNLAPEIKAILDRIKKERGTKNNENQHLGDTSNTFFASLALGTVAEIGLPIEDAIAQMDRRFGLTIHHSGWSYYPGKPPQQQTVANVPLNGNQFNAGNLDPRSNFAALQTVYRDVIVAAGRGIDGKTLGTREGQQIARTYAAKGFGTRVDPLRLVSKESRRDPRLMAQVEWVVVVSVPIGKAAVGSAPPPIPTLPKLQFTTMVLTGPPAEMTVVESQGETGKLSPNPRPVGPTPSMTAAGIACLAMGIAVNREPPSFLGHNSEQVHLVRKTCILNGLQGLAGAVGEPVKDPKKVAKLKKDNSYYLLFSINQMANLLGLKTIAGKDYHAWGTQLLLANQEKDGSWQGHFGAADTAFALLFLTKSDLTPAASRRLRDEIRDPGLPKHLQKKKDKSPGEK